MLKGHAKIELTDVNTGEVTVHEEDNMFTNAIYKTLNNTWTSLVGGVNSLKSWHLPLSQKMLGGIALFEDRIEEAETMNHFPKGNKVIACAGTISSDGATKHWGGRNTLESEPYDSETRSVKHVWDFSTAEANGTISAVGLMDGRQADYYGQSAWNKDVGRALDVTGYFEAYGKHIAEFKGNEFVAMTNGTGTVTIKKVKFNFDTVSLNNNLGTTEVISEKVVSLPNSSMNYTCTYWFDGDDGYWYGFIDVNNSSYSSPKAVNITQDYNVSQYWQVIRINKDTYAMEYHNINTSGMYIYPKAFHPVITQYYIVLPGSSSTYQYETSSSSTQVNNVIPNKVGCISKSDWSWSVKDLNDSDGNNCSMFITEGRNYMLHFIFGVWSNLKLKNGLYQMGEVIFDDNVVVQEQIKHPINMSTGAPQSYNSGAHLRINLNPMSSPGSMYPDSYYGRTCLGGVCMYMLPNEDKEIILIGCHCSGWGGQSSETFKVFIVPYDSQKLMTINNLTNPVTKTASQTMKVTYTITDVDE